MPHFSSNFSTIPEYSLQIYPTREVIIATFRGNRVSERGRRSVNLSYPRNLWAVDSVAQLACKLRFSLTIVPPRPRIVFCCERREVVVASEVHHGHLAGVGLSGERGQVVCRRRGVVSALEFMDGAREHEGVESEGREGAGVQGGGGARGGEACVGRAGGRDHPRGGAGGGAVCVVRL